MASKYLVSIASCFLLALTQVNGQQVVDGKIKITTGTTSGCGDTVNFISNQLAEAYRLYSDFLELEFVPWGRTTWNDTHGMVCQFGENDCWANRLQRCVLNMLKDNQDAQMHYMACEFSTPYPSFLQGSYLCAQAVGVSLIEVDHCVANDKDDLDRAAQAVSVVPMATINFVPFILFNDAIDIELHNQARTRLASMICFALAEDPSTGINNCQI